MLVGLHYATILPLMGAVVLAAALVYSILGKKEYTRLARAGFALVAAGWLLYLAAFLRLDYSLAEVAKNANEDLSLALRVGASWAGSGSSLYLYATILSLAGLYALGRLDRPAARRYVAAATALTLIILASAGLNGAFETMSGDVGGFGINPLLKNYWLIPHPLTTFGGYSLLLAGSLILLFSKRKWKGMAVFLLGWVFLSLGIALGGIWSYETFGWGGYWAWDPVEVAELTVWLAATTALHMVGPLAPLRRPFLALTASTTLLAPFVTRSGLSPLHSFAAANIGSVLLLISSLAFLGLFFAELLKVATRVDLAGRIRQAFRESGIQQLSISIAGLAVAAMALFVYASLLAPSILVVLGREASVPTMQEGVRFYHPVLFPLYIVALLWIPGYFLPGITTRGFTAYAATTIALGAVALAGVREGVLTPLPQAPLSTNYQAALGLAVSSMALAALLVSTAWPLAERILRRAATAPFRDYVLKLIHLGMTLAFIGVLLSGTYAFNETYFKSYTLEPGKTVEVAGVKLTLEGFEYQVNPGYLDYKSHVEKENLLSVAAWQALTMLRMDIAPALKETLEVKASIPVNETARLIRDLVVNLYYAPAGSVKEATANGSIVLVDLQKNQTKIIAAKEPITLSSANTTLIPIFSPIRGQDGGLVGASISLAIAASNLTIEAEGFDNPPTVHTYLSIEFENPLTLDLGNLTVEADSVEVYIAAQSPSQDTQAELVDGKVVIYNAYIYVNSGRINLSGSELELPVNVSRGFYLYLQALLGNAALLEDLMKSSFKDVLLDGKTLNLAVGSSPGAINLPTKAPSGVSLVLKIRVEANGESRVETVRLRFEANGEAIGIHGLVTPAFIVRAGLSDIYMHIQPPILEGYFGSYHELLVYYVKTLMEKLPSSQALATTALMAAGYEVNEITQSPPNQMGLIVERALLDLYLLAEKFEPNNSTIIVRGITLTAKVVPSVNLIWLGVALMTASALVSSFIYVKLGRKEAEEQTLTKDLEQVPTEPTETRAKEGEQGEDERAQVETSREDIPKAEDVDES